MPDYLVIENDIVVNAILANSLEDAIQAVGSEVIESENGIPWIGWIKFDDGVWRLPQPYPSWVWSGTEWNAPMAHPDDSEHIWEWDEENQVWDRLPLPQPYPSWLLDDNEIWAPPVFPPEDIENYYWDEDSLSWLPKQQQ